MKNNKIIIVFISIIIVMIGGYFCYNYQQKVALAQYYYDTGDYKQASDLNVGKISKKALSLENASDWQRDKNNAEQLSDDILLMNMEIKYVNTDDKNYTDKLKTYYKEIADYFGVSVTRLTEIGNMKSEQRQIEVQKLLSNRKSNIN